jgi:hypothetical protein
LYQYEGNWSRLYRFGQTETNNSNLVINNNKLEIKQLKEEDFGLYMCHDELRSTKILYRIEFVNKYGNINGRIESVQLNNSVRLDFKTSVENIKNNSTVIIKCSTPNCKLFYL